MRGAACQVADAERLTLGVQDGFRRNDVDVVWKGVCWGGCVADLGLFVWGEVKGKPKIIAKAVQNDLAKSLSRKKGSIVIRQGDFKFDSSIKCVHGQLP